MGLLGVPVRTASKLKEVVEVADAACLLQLGSSLIPFSV